VGTGTLSARTAKSSIELTRSIIRVLTRLLVQRTNVKKPWRVRGDFFDGATRKPHAKLRAGVIYYEPRPQNPKIQVSRRHPAESASWDNRVSRPKDWLRAGPSLSRWQDGEATSHHSRRTPIEDAGFGYQRRRKDLHR